MPLELRHLRNFLAVVEQRSISKGASVLRLAQPALSRQLLALEIELGAALLVRHGWGVTPTPEGEILARHARNLLDQAQAARDAVTAASGSPAGRLALGVPSSMAAIVLPELALAAQKALPRVQLRLVEGYSANLHQRLVSGELDTAILYKERRRSVLVTYPLLDEPLVAIGAPGLFAKRKTITVPELLALNPILPASANQLRTLVEESAARSDSTGVPIMEVDSVPALLELVAANAGASVLPYSTVHAFVEQGRLSYAEIGPEPLTRQLVVARSAERLETPLWTAVVRLLIGILSDKEDLFAWSVTDALAGSNG